MHNEERHPSQRVARGNSLPGSKPRRRKQHADLPPLDTDEQLREAIARAIRIELEGSDEAADGPLLRHIPEDPDLFDSFIADLPPEDNTAIWDDINELQELVEQRIAASSLPAPQSPIDDQQSTIPDPETETAPRSPLPDPIIWPECTATTRRGDACGFPARRGSDSCINHDPEYREQQRHNRLKGSENARKARNRPPINFDNVDLSDRASIQAFVETVISLELRGSLSAHRARNLIRLLSLASRNLRTSNFGWVQGHEAHHGARYRNVRSSIEAHLGELLEDAPRPQNDQTPASKHPHRGKRPSKRSSRLDQEDASRVSTPPASLLPALP